MKVAFATQDIKNLNAHFAGARNLAIYDVTAEGYRFVEAVRFDLSSNEDGVHAEANEDRITPRVDALAGGAVLFVLAIGGPAAARVISRKIHPIKLPRPRPTAVGYGALLPGGARKGRDRGLRSVRPGRRRRPGPIRRQSYRLRSAARGGRRAAGVSPAA